MQQGFQSRIAEVVTLDGRNFKLSKPIEYVAKDGALYTVPEWADTDGASTPRSLWSVLPPFGDYWLACVLHDAAYRNTLRKGGTSANLTKEQSDNLLLEAMQSCQVDEIACQTIYEGVKWGGFKAFRDDRK